MWEPMNTLSVNFPDKVTGLPKKEKAILSELFDIYNKHYTANVKKNKYYKDEEDIDDEILKDAGFISWEDEGSEYLEGFYQEFTTPSGETIVAFGEYGYDG